MSRDSDIRALRPEPPNAPTDSEAARALAHATWPLARVGEAMVALAHATGLKLRAADVPKPPSHVLEGDASLGPWIERVAEWLGIEAEAVGASFMATAALVRGAGPAIVLLRVRSETRLLVLVRGTKKSVFVLDPELQIRSFPVLAIRDALCRPLEAPLLESVDALLERAGVPLRRRSRARAALLAERLVRERIECWVMRLAPGAPFGQQLQDARVPRRLVLHVVAYGVQVALAALSWWMLGRGALDGRLDMGWLLAWGLLLVTQLPFRVASGLLQANVGIDAGVLLKRRLLAGALTLRPEEVRTDGAGRMLGRVIESEALESLAMSAGFAGVMATFELAAAMVILATGLGGGLECGLLLVWAGLTLLLVRRHARSRGEWTQARLSMTHDLVESMVGHRTRLAQQLPAQMHDGDDESALRYLRLSERMDRAWVGLAAIMPRGWLVLGILGLAPALVFGGASPASLAIALGGILVGHRALGRVVHGASSISGAAIAWREVAPLFDAAARTESAASPQFAFTNAQGGERDDGPLLEAHDVVFRYQEHGRPALRGCTLRIDANDRVLLEGASGGGKSTLGSILAGLRIQESGLVLLDGLDHRTLGSAGWRRRVVAAPQFHENHVLSGTLAFNLLMGREWPPTDGDLRDAEDVCRELGLGDLIARMPSGLQQMVGETGWQLSHGEKSRVYIARALLQNADLVILDESLAALDPGTLTRAMQCVLARARALVVIAHP